MKGIYAQCPIHGFFKTSNLISSGPGNEVTFNNVKINCPKCGRMSKIIDGTYGFDDKGLAEFIEGPEFSKDIYEQFQHLVQLAKEENLTKEEVVRKTEAFSPKLSNFINQAGVKEKGSLVEWLMFILALIGMYVDKSEPKTTNNYYFFPQTYQSSPKPVRTVRVAKSEITTDNPGTGTTRPKKKRKSLVKAKPKSDTVIVKVIQELPTDTSANKALILKIAKGR